MDSKGTIVVQKGDLRTLFDLVCSPLAGHNPIKCIHAALHRGVCLKRGSTVDVRAGAHPFWPPSTVWEGGRTFA